MTEEAENPLVGVVWSLYHKKNFASSVVKKFNPAGSWIKVIPALCLFSFEFWMF